MNNGSPVVGSLFLAFSFTCTPTMRPESSRKNLVTMRFVLMDTPSSSAFSARGTVMAEPWPRAGWMVRTVLWPP